ncbi:S8 family serine peptidase [Paenibacillus glycanilyticus]|uniref:S8 family serine peptidase n=1 Tax=Paenibacillus glycanilyticus TaxID=126569 RepID=UPI00203C55DF|nr:S8 family serine peptidase [Paenibacillus glycanilyticus]MCM3626287.1 S8 family serine peptidase [Paenibacillus glycanilyticus]
MNRLLVKKSLMLGMVSLLAGSLLTTSLPDAYAAPRDKTAFVNKENIQSIIRQLQEAETDTGLNAVPSEGYVAEDIDTSSAEKINVIVQLSGQPAAVGQYAARMGYKALALQANDVTVQSEQDAFVRQAQTSNIPFTIDRRFNTVLNGMEITIRANLIPELAKLPGVKSIHKNVIYYPIVENDGYQAADSSNRFDTIPLEQIGVMEAWERGLTGEGLKVGVLDTGVDYLHPDLAGAYEEGGYDAINLDDDPYEDLPVEGRGGSEHGTHVSGTIVGQASNPKSDFVQKGVAYNAKLYAYKVLGPDGGTSAQVIDGIEHAVEDKMDVINLSLGSDLEKDPNSPDATAVNNAVLAGVVAVVANGNAGANGHYYYSMGSPASSQLAISVGAATSDGNRYSGSVYSSVGPAEGGSGDAMGYDANLSLISWTTGQENFNEIFGTTPIQGVYVGIGADSDYEGLDKDDLADKIVFISRGILTFDEKVKLAAKHGAKAAIIFNGNSKSSTISEPDLSDEIPSRDGPIGPLAFLGDSYEYIPAFDMPGKMGRALARELLAHPDQTLTFTMKNDFASHLVDGDRMADFSSRGPNSDGNYGIKPDVGAPGVQILSTVPAYGQADSNASYDKAYARMSGTSMASPHVAGLALLLKQAHPEWTPFDIRAALANTAQEIHDENGTLYDVYSQGAGRVDVINAVDTPAIIESLDEITIYDDQMNPTVIPSQATSVSFGKLYPGSEAVKKPLRVTNLSNDSVAYKTKIVMHPSVTSDPAHPIPTPDPSSISMGLEGVAGNQITVAANGQFDFQLIGKVIPNAPVGVYEGEVLLESEGHPSLHLPFVLHVGDQSDGNGFLIQNLTLSKPTVSQNAPIDITASLPTREVNHLFAAILDMNGELLGTVAEIYDLDEEKEILKPLPANVIIPEFDGSYAIGIDNYNSNKVTAYLPKGTYKLVLVGSVYDENYELLDETAAFKTFYMSGEGDGPITPPNPPNPPLSGSGPQLPSEPAYNKEIAASVLEAGQTSVAITAQSSLEGNQLSVTLTDGELQTALDQAKQTSVALTIAAASDKSDAAKLKITAKQVMMIKEAKLKGVVAFAWNEAAMALPLSVLEQLPEGADLVISMKKDAGSKSEFAKQVQGASILGTPYSFEAGSLKGDAASPLALKPDQVVKRSFLIEKGIEVSSAGALYLSEGTVYPIPAKITSASGGGSIVTISRPGFSTYAAAKRHVTFTDINKSWAKDKIQTLADKFLLNGTSEHTFSPKKEVTRAQFASMLVRALGLQVQGGASPFRDVKTSDWFAQDVTAAFKAGLITGVNEQQFKPNDKITRQDLTVMLARAIELIGLSNTIQAIHHPYADASQFSSYARNSIQIVTDAGLMGGYESAGKFYFRPTEATTREAAAKVLHDLLQVAGRM